MPLTRAFKSGNSQAVRIPAELAYEDMNVDLTISRHGDVIVIAPARRNLTEVVAALRARRDGLHVVVTGRNAKPELIEAADLVTEMSAVKHHFDAGVRAQEGVEF